MRPVLQSLLVLIIVSIGALAFAIGEVDDSPGLMLMGVLVGAGAVGLGVMFARRGRQSP